MTRSLISPSQWIQAWKTENSMKCDARIQQGDAKQTQEITTDWSSLTSVTNCDKFQVNIHALGFVILEMILSRLVLFLGQIGYPCPVLCAQSDLSHIEGGIITASSPLTFSVQAAERTTTCAHWHLHRDWSCDSDNGQRLWVALSFATGAGIWGHY